MVLSGPGEVNSLAKTTMPPARVANLSPGMAATGVAEHVQRRSGAYWRDPGFSPPLPPPFFFPFLPPALVLPAGAPPPGAPPHHPRFLFYLTPPPPPLPPPVCRYAARLP